ncbi:immune inhibitor A peptidase M6 [Tahibacter aquaticus]|uniref:Immune inhibitor A peptidase M6 n=1 Tax=Tahibacter aquaticus TaxID=520092 RepID=A0A4R6YR65_9GAMM|nr:S8 family serine peptidase [Tahibacter aquaticus]TDR40440.1 immune inhibitor A peptidase M6 [Tahibacter aquaticus]
MKRHRLAAAISLLIVAGAVSAQGSRLVAPQGVSPEQLTDARIADSRLLLTRAGMFDPTQEAVDYSATGAAPATAIARYGVVQFVEGDTTARARLEKQGVRILGYVPNNAYIVRLDDSNSLASLNRDGKVRWSGLYQPGMKLDPLLYSANRGGLIASPVHGGYDIEVFAFSGESANQLAEALLKVSGVDVSVINARDENPYVRVNVNVSSLDALVRAATAQEGVAWVSWYRQPKFDNAAAIGVIQGNSVATGTAGSGPVEANRTPLWDHGIFGSNQIVAVSDSGMDANEAWFTTLDKGSGPVTAVATPQSPAPPTAGTLAPTQKVIGYWVQPGATSYDNNATCPGGSPTSFHGTHTTGTVAGDAAGTFGATTYLASTPTAANHELADGMAPNAQLLFLDIGNDTSGCLSITDLTGTLKQGFAGGARIHSASWGAPSAGVYSGNDFEADYVLNSSAEDMIFVVSAGNEGPGATTTGSPGNAKNAITVGALNHAGSTAIISFSSRGPTADGRRKPDVMAPGTSTVSASGDATTNATPEAPVSKALSGTSMSAPTIAGNAALLRQYFADGFYPRGTATAADKYNPSGMAMKAVILNGTNPISATAFNSNNFGWGRMWLDSNLWFANTLTGGDDSRRLRLFERTQASGLATGQQHEYTIANVAAGQDLRATLTWYDVEAQQGSVLSIVNNLDLEVVGPGGTYLGNVFTSGVSTTGGTADSRNSVEQFRLTAPTAGSYTFRVKGTSVPGGSRPNSNRQGYALAVSGAFGLPAGAAFAAPVATTAANNGNNVDVAFTAAGGAQGFQLYRANGTCAAAAAGDFRLVGTGAASPLSDTTPRNGQTYAYKVRGVSGDIEGDASNCVEVTASAACTLQPEFQHESLAVNSTQGTTCKIGMGWAAAPANCATATGVTYKVERDSTPYFTAPSTLAPAHASNSYDDFSALFAKPYFYRVTATDSLGNSAPPSIIANGTAIGPSGVRGATYRDDGDNNIFVAMDAPWRVTNTAASAGTLSYHSGYDNVTYPANVCASLTTPKLLVQAGATLRFKAKYDIEYQWDGMVTEISTDDGLTWSDLPPDGGYPNTLAATQGNGCGYPATHGAFTGVTTAASNADPNNGSAAAVFKPFTRDLSAYAGQNVRLRWRLSTDGGAEFSGAFVDEIDLNGNALDALFIDSFESNSQFNCSN